MTTVLYEDAYDMEIITSDVDNLSINSHEEIIVVDEEQTTLDMKISLPDDIADLTMKQVDRLATKSAESHMVYPTGITAIDDWCEGGFSPGKLILLAAYPNFGKSACLQTFVRGMLDLSNDTIALCFSIDDTMADYYSRYLAGESKIPIWCVNQANNRQLHDTNHGTSYEQNYANGYNRFKSFTSRRMMVKGAMDVMSSDRTAPTALEAIEKIIKDTYIAVRTKCNMRPQLIVTVDSPRNIKVKEGNLASNPTALVEYIGSTVKSWLDLSVDINGESERIDPIILTTEHIKKLPREQKRPGMDDIKDSITLQYHADMVLMLWNDACYKARVLKTQEPSDMLFERTDLKDKRNKNRNAMDPVVELSLGKNKMGRMHYSGASATTLLYFYQDQSRMVEISDKTEFDSYACLMD